MNRRSLLEMTTAAGAGGVLHAGALLGAERTPAGAGAGTHEPTGDSAGTVSIAATTPVAELPRAAFIHRKDGTALFYKDWGAGRPMLFVCSAGLDCDMWAYQMVPFTALGLRCVTFDRRGHGRSSDPGRGYDFDTLADDLAAVIEALGLRRVTLVSHSTGCAEVVRYLSRHGDSRVSKVVLLAPTTPVLPEPEDQLQGSRADFHDELRGVRVPTLVIHGTNDASAPLEITGKRTADLIPGCELQVYDGAPHGLFITHMQRVNDDVLRFMRT